MKIIIPGGSGHLGQTLARDFHANGHEVVVLSRHRDQLDLPCRSVFWDGATWGEWAADIDGADVVINLAGRSVNCRYTPANRREILNSRLNSTRVVGEADRSRQAAATRLAASRDGDHLCASARRRQ